MNQPNNAQHVKDLDFMEVAIDLAHRSEAKGEVPIGALIVDDTGKVIAKATNLRETNLTVLGHAELVAIHRACKKLKTWRLTGCTLYVTLEPCHMCAGALVQSRIKRVVFGAFDPKGGALGTLTNLAEDKRLNHNFETIGGIKQEECAHQLKTFFKKKRTEKKKSHEAKA